MTPMTLGKRTGPERTMSWKLVALPASVGMVRGYAGAALRKWGLDHLIDNATLVVSELVTNACAPKAARGQEITFRLSYLPTGLVLIEVTDPSPGRPEVKKASKTDIHGRGLLIVQALSAEFGYRDETGGGKTVWAILAADPQ